MFRASLHPSSGDQTAFSQPHSARSLPEDSPTSQQSQQDRKTLGSENAVWPPDDERKDPRNMLRDYWLPIKLLIVASSWSRLYLRHRELNITFKPQRKEHRTENLPKNYGKKTVKHKKVCHQSRWGFSEHPFWRKKEWRFNRKVESRISWRGTEKIQIKLATGTLTRMNNRMSKIMLNFKPNIGRQFGKILKRVLEEADTDLSKLNSWRMVVVMVKVFTA